MGWFFRVSSDAYPTSIYGPYDNEGEALEGIERIKIKVAKLSDDIEREYSWPEEKGEDY
ncbi:hypothetical protein LCGC14_2593950 [marine sediment metagenome]|uniref:Uncharacterized protein n=1 Tax=marine sediment metagenome TaxID=412755 RepID=A0A0F9AYN9_9ZZZZ